MSNLNIAGDSNGRALLLLLLQAACGPYFRMLELWLCQGVLDDPYSEFMVQEKKVRALYCGTACIDFLGQQNAVFGCWFVLHMVMCCTRKV